MQKGIGTIHILVILALLVLAGSAGYIYMQPKKEVSKPPESKPAIETTAPQSAPIPTPTNETANWKTYLNEKHGYAVKYPKDVKVGNFDPSGFVPATLNSDDVGIFLPNDGGEGRGSIAIKILLQTTKYNHRYCMSLLSAVEKAKCAFPDTPNVENLNPQNIIFAGINALKVGNNIDFGHNNVEYRIQSYFIESNRHTIDSILNLFKFNQ